MAAAPLPEGWLRQWPWATFVLPFFVFGIVTSYEPKPPDVDANPVATEARESAHQPSGGLDDAASQSAPVAGERLAEPPVENEIAADSRAKKRREYLRYPTIYTWKIALTALAMLAVWKGYRTFPWRVSPWSVVVGTVGVVVWIVLCRLRLEPRLFGAIDFANLGLADYFRGLGQRSAFNPLVELGDRPAWAYGFLAVRFFGLACIVPVIEEFFLRGLVMRWFVNERWEEVPFGNWTLLSLVAGSALPMLSHPGELLAALAWFSLVSWLMIRTRNIWDCVVAHGVTNLLLGVYVVTVNTPESWQLM